MAKDPTSEFADEQVARRLGGDGTMRRGGVANAPQTGFFGHPRGLATLFMTEFWERFSYYGMRAILVLFMIAAIDQGGLGYSAADAGAVYGLYTSLVYIVSLPGGWLADRLLGQRRSVLYGGAIIALGELTLAIPNEQTFFLGLALIILGTGLLKPNISTMVGQLYAPEDERRDAGFSIFYMGINMGAFIAPLIVGYIGQNINWHYGFLVAGIGMVLGLIQYVLGDKHLGEAGKHPVAEGDPAERARDIRTIGYAAGAVVALIALLFAVDALGILRITLQGLEGVYGIGLVLVVLGVFAWLFLGGQWTAEERARLSTIAFLFVAAVVFFGAFEQAGSTLTILADRQTDRSVPGWIASLFNLEGGQFPASWFQTANPLFIISLAPVFAWLWVWLGRRNPSSPVKFGFGLFFLAVGYLIIWYGTSLAAHGVAVSPWWLVGMYFFHTLGELSLSPVGLSAMTRLAPARIASFIMGVWFMAASTGNYLGGYLTKYYEQWGPPPFFLTITIFVFSAAALTFLLSRPIDKMLARAKG